MESRSSTFDEPLFLPSGSESGPGSRISSTSTSSTEQFRTLSKTASNVANNLFVEPVVNPQNGYLTCPGAGLRVFYMEMR